uniref:Ectoine hydroxylase-like protein 165 n=1 Tax=Saccoglossus kowalevskii TaxID=10224 RepID=A0A1L7H7H4_SACKO|nr:ectoine hydroxylase-like protein 165 [Saccoglossus kowalevskii]
MYSRIQRIARFPRLVPAIKLSHRVTSQVNTGRLYCSATKDLYPTRENECKVLPRLDPVVWNNPDGKFDGPLSSAELQEYEKNGYLILKDLFSPEEMEPVIRECKAVQKSIECNQYDIKTGEEAKIAMELNSTKLRSYVYAHEDIESVKKLSRNAKLVNRARQILADEVYILQSRVNYHQAYVGQGISWHHDFDVFHADDGIPRMRALTFAVMLDKNTPETGATMLVPGSHRNFLTSLGPTPDNSWVLSITSKSYAGIIEQHMLTPVIESHGIEHATGDVGTVYLFDINTIHCNNVNVSPFNRVNVFLLYNSIKNKAIKPFSAPHPRRPEFIATKDNAVPIVPE